MSAPYIPPTTSGFDTWGANFSALITADPTRYGLDSLAAASIQSAYDLFHVQYLLAGTTMPHNVPVNPSTRTPVTVAAMRTQLGASRAIYRTYASQIRINPGVTNDDKVALGLNLPNTSPTPVPQPVSYPLLSFLSAGPLTHTFSYKDSDTPDGKAKPQGVVQMQLVGEATETVVVDPDTLPPLTPQTKSPFMITWFPGDGSKTAYYASRWVTRRGLVGPWSPIAAALILEV